jgi:hypothetical protein
VKGTWREGSLAGDPEGYLEKTLEIDISFNRGPILGNLEEGSSTGDFESWTRGLWGRGICLSRGSVEGASGVAPSLGTLEDMLGRSPDTGISLHGFPFPWGEPGVCGQGSYIRDFDR